MSNNKKSPQKRIEYRDEIEIKRIEDWFVEFNR